MNRAPAAAGRSSAVPTDRSGDVAWWAGWYRGLAAGQPVVTVRFAGRYLPHGVWRLP